MLLREMIGFSGGGGGSGIGISVNGSNGGANALNFGQTPSAPTGALNVTWQRDALNPANASAYVMGATSSTLGRIQLGGASNELQAGIESVEPQNNFWGVDLSDRELEAKKEMQAVLTLLSSRSKSVM